MEKPVVIQLSGDGRYYVVKCVLPDDLKEGDVMVVEKNGDLRRLIVNDVVVGTWNENQPRIIRPGTPTPGPILEILKRRPQ